VSLRVVLAANSAWNIVTFRQGLVRGLAKAGYDPVLIAAPDVSADQRMQALGVERITVNLDRSGLNPISDLKLLRAYRGILKRVSPAAFLGFTIKPNIYGCIAASSLGIPAIPNVSGLGTAFLMGGPLRALITAMYRFAFKRCPAVFFQNPDDLELFVDGEIIQRSQARLVPGSGIDLAYYAPAPLPVGPPSFLLIGRLLRDKGICEYVEAARMLRAEYPDARFQLLGPIDRGNRSAVRQDELDRWIADGAIEYLGSADDVRPQIAAASMMVLPSYREGLPRSLLEGAAMGRPLIATDVPGCRQVVDRGVNGLLCEARNGRSLADAMRAFIQMPAHERSEMGLAARRTVEERFSEERVVQAYIDALDAFARPG
jgi:glycosyltransferase involved in cell wall biosynthesis